MKAKTILMATALMASGAAAQQPTDVLTPELLWEMGRIGSATLSPDGNTLLYSVTHYSKKQNNSTSRIWQKNLADGSQRQLAQGAAAAYIGDGTRVAYLRGGKLYVGTAQGGDFKAVAEEVGDFLFSPDGSKVILVKEVPMHESIAKNDDDLPKATGMVINDLMYKHWDHYVTAVPHPFIASFDGQTLTDETDLLAGEPFESPMEPFGGIEQLAWSPDGRYIAYTCRKKTGVDYAISTDSDIYLYDTTTHQTVKNLCKPEGWQAPAVKTTESLEHQAPNNGTEERFAGYDQNPQFSPDGKYVAWTSMARDGYESDRTRLCVYTLKNGKFDFVTESLETGVETFVWGADSKTLYFTACWHGKINIYQTTLKGKVEQLTDDVADYSICELTPDKQGLLVKKHSMSHPDDVFTLSLDKKGAQLTQLTDENKDIFAKITTGEVKERWVKTVDGKEEQCWVIYPPHFDPTKKYPTLLYCEGGPQSPVSQFWSFRWNFQMMAANGYIIIAPNRRGLPGYGMEWLEEISGDYTGLCMQDYLSAIDDISKENYVDKDRRGAVGASFGGFSVYWLAGNHHGRFKAFIAHDGIYNTQQQYVETEEMWFPNWDLGGAPWLKPNDGQMRKAYAQSPHLYVDQWDTPILCIHGQRDFRIEYTQAESAFAAARLRGIDAQLLLFPDENHWVLKPQNGILWQRTFFRWLDKWLKK